MKFWEVVSAFRTHPDLIRKVFERGEWREPYLLWYQKLADLVDRQDRGILDALVPMDLSRALISLPHYAARGRADGSMRCARSKF